MPHRSINLPRWALLPIHYWLRRPMEMMTTDAAVQAARDHFDRTPILPGHSRVLVQAGIDWYWHELPAAEI
jgi:hypothetical protein